MIEPLRRIYIHSCSYITLFNSFRFDWVKSSRETVMVVRECNFKTIEFFCFLKNTNVAWLCIVDILSITFKTKRLLVLFQGLPGF